MCAAPYTVCLLIWVAKPETSHVLQGNKNKTYRGHCDRLSVHILQSLRCEQTRLGICGKSKFNEATHSLMPGSG